MKSDVYNICGCYEFTKDCFLSVVTRRLYIFRKSYFANPDIFDDIFDRREYVYVK